MVDIFDIEFGRGYRRIDASFLVSDGLITDFRFAFVLHFVLSGVIAGFVTWSGIYYYQHLETTPITNRSRFVMLQAKHLVEMGQIQAKAVCTSYYAFFVAVTELSISFQLLTMHESAVLPVDDARSQRVRKIARRILEANMDLPQVKNTEWRIYVVESQENNAFVLPVSAPFCSSFLWIPAWLP